MRSLQEFLLGMFLLAFAGSASAANVSCERMHPEACTSPMPVEHCPDAPAKQDCAARCGLMCAAITPFPIAPDTPRPVKDSVAVIRMHFLPGLNARPEPPPPRRQPGLNSTHSRS